MQAIVITYLPWLLSGISIWMAVLAGDKNRHAWAVGIVNQGLWLIWIVASRSWGFVPLNLVLWVVYARNHLKWREPAVQWTWAKAVANHFEKDLEAAKRCGDVRVDARIFVQNLPLIIAALRDYRGPIEHGHEVRSKK